MSDLKDLERRLQGCPHANLKELSEEHFTVEFLKRSLGGLRRSFYMAQDTGLPVGFQPDELEKCMIHYCVRNLIQDLWELGSHKIGEFLDPCGRFNLENALETGKYDNLSNDLSHNLDIGGEIVMGITADLYDEWMENLKDRNALEASIDPIPLMFRIYTFYSWLINGGDRDLPSILANTLVNSTGKERYKCLVDYPNLTRQELETISERIVEDGIKQASQLAIKSHVQEKVVIDIHARGELAYVFDPNSKKIIFNPEYAPDLERVEAKIQEQYPDQTKLLLMCPAKFVPSKLYNGGGMLHDLLRFKGSVFVEIYLATHNRR